jgi:hypothetical protein
MIPKPDKKLPGLERGSIICLTNMKLQNNNVHKIQSFLAQSQ